MTGNILFQSKVSANVFKVEISILKQAKISTAFGFMLEEMSNDILFFGNHSFTSHIIDVSFYQSLIYFF